VHSASVCTRHGDELRIVNNVNELRKRLCSIMGHALDDDDDDDDDDGDDDGLSIGAKIGDLG